MRKEARLNEATFATVKSMPFLLNDREFVFKHIWKVEEGGKSIICQESSGDQVDYGASLRVTRGFCRGLWVMDNLQPKGGAKQVRSCGDARDSLKIRLTANFHSAE